MTPEEEAEFFDRFPLQFPGRVYSDDTEDIDFCALVVTDDIPVDTINKILSENVANMRGSRYVQLADTYENLPDYSNVDRKEGTEPSVVATWQSPFIGKSLHEIALWIRGIPKPPKAISKTYFAILQKELYECERKVLICRIFGGDRIKRIETAPMRASKFGQFVPLFRREDWRQAHENQKVY